MSLTATQLTVAVPRVNTAVWLDALNVAMREFDISTPARAAAFLAQCAHESSDFTRLVENLNYSADGLANTWPSRFATAQKTVGRRTPNAAAHRLARNPEAIANHVYANRLGNGDEASGDGWRFRGRGLIQLTGRANYRVASGAFGIDLVDEPQTLEQPALAALVSAWWWSANRVNAIADRGDWLAVSRAVNLGNAASPAMPHGHDDRRARTLAALDALQDYA
ncbi:putative chitinase [Paraburkholderia sp. WSM4175]|uniref:glycoside hydrolase family 19 protein n=1 Tax=Paraburkholderia sp. WSM4175 TaxID=2991072 RepID=UPI003D1C1BFE